MEHRIIKVSLLIFAAFCTLLLLSNSKQVKATEMSIAKYQLNAISQYMKNNYIKLSTAIGSNTSADGLCEKLIEGGCPTETLKQSREIKNNTPDKFSQKYLEGGAPVVGNKSILTPAIKSNISRNNLTEKVQVPIQNVSKPLNQTTGREFLTYENSTLGIKIQYPTGWKLMKVGNLPYLTNIFVSPLENNTDRYRENAFLKINDVSPNLTLNDFTSKITKTLQNRSDFRILDFSSVSLSDNPGYRIIGLTRGNQNINVLDEWTIKDGKVYRVAFYLEEGKSKTYLPIAQRMINSFEITKQ
jgi:PsbP-like protein